ncbi:hypothetical protein Patl1_33271 [Pistacia atlantica]|uniref:Uncharacterized protein n=1 Tax=Pistacia atlantica TaxID=434234 RepID=A0ACC1ARH3_9ROSI|nr:hypothetical protein Patl1_33271 [Pistacia atlantica]
MQTNTLSITVSTSCNIGLHLYLSCGVFRGAATWCWMISSTGPLRRRHCGISFAIIIMEINHSKMYEEPGCFDPNNFTAEGAGSGFPQAVQQQFEENMDLSVDELSYHHHNHQEDAAVSAMELELQKHLAFNVENCDNNIHMMQQVELQYKFITPNTRPSQSLSLAQFLFASKFIHLLCKLQTMTLLVWALSKTSQPHIAHPVLYDPLFHLNLPPQPPLFSELFQSIPQGYSLPTSRGGASSLFGDERDSSGVTAHQDGDGGMLEFTRDMACIVRRSDTGQKKKPFTTERQRREQWNDKFEALRNMVPSPTKYIKELLRTVNEIKLLVERKRCVRERSKRHKTEDDAGEDVKNCNIWPLGDPDQSYIGSLRSSWLQRKSKDTEVDVRIIDDEVTIKLFQRKKIDCLLFVSKVLEELKLDLHHVAGGHIGDYYSFLFNTKIYEGSSLYAGAIANKVIEVMDREYAAVPPTSSY